jgi:hypothetical protein
MAVAPTTPSERPGLTRRRLLAGAGAAALAASLPSPVLAATAAPARRGLAFRRLTERLRRSGDPRFRHADPARAAGALARWTDAQPGAARAYAAAVLDGLAGRAPRSAQDRAALAAAAVTLAASVHGPPPLEDEKSPLP